MSNFACAVHSHDVRPTLDACHARHATSLPLRGRLSAVPVVAGALIMVAMSFSNANMIPRFRIWEREVSDLSQMGRWIGAALPSGALVATFANGAFSYRAG